MKYFQCLLMFMLLGLSHASLAVQYVLHQDDEIILEYFNNNNTATTYPFRCEAGAVVRSMTVYHKAYVNGVRFSCSALKLDGSLSDGKWQDEFGDYPISFGRDVWDISQ